MPTLFSVVSLVFLVLTGCGSPLIEGWRDDNKDERTPEERCEARDGHSWSEGACKKDADINPLQLTSKETCERSSDKIWIEAAADSKCIFARDAGDEAVCKLAEGRGWQWARGKCVTNAEAQCEEGQIFLNDKCESRPTLETKGGGREQTIAGGQVMTPVELVVTAGATVEITSQTCPDFFALSSHTLGMVKDIVPPAGATSCEATLVASFTPALVSESVTVKVIVTKGFLELCKDPETSSAASYTILKIIQGLEKNDCDDAAKALGDVASITLEKLGITDVSPLRGLGKLTALHLSGNDIENLEPLTGLAGLKVLDLDGNEVKDVTPLAGLTGLQVLSLRFNPLGSPPPNGVAKTDANCPTGDAVSARVRTFCKEP